MAGSKRLPVTASFGYLFNKLAHSESAKLLLDQLRSGSPLAAKMLDSLAADSSTVYYFDTGPLPESTGGGRVNILRQEPSFWNKLTGNGDALSVTVVVTIDPKSTAYFTDVNGNSFYPSSLRVMAHELGHAFSWRESNGNFVVYRMSYDHAVIYENAIARELNKNAPLRAKSDHGTGRP